MHEYSLAMDMMEAVLKAAEENNAKKVNSVSISIGRLAHASPVQLEFCLRSIAEGTIAQDAEYTFGYLDLTISCGCGYTKNLNGEDTDIPENSYDLLTYLTNMTCPRCGKRVGTEGGQELFVDAIDID